MSESRSALLTTAERLFCDGQPASDNWDAAVDAGFPLLLVPEERGGLGADWGDLMAIARLAGFHAFSVPLPDMVAAGALLPESAGQQGAGVLAASAARTPEGGRFSGSIHGLSWGRCADYAITWNDEGAHAIALAGAALSRGNNPAGERHDDLHLRDAQAWQANGAVHPRLVGAAIRTAQIAGALARILELTIEHVNTREQFGRPIARFQAVQQNVALLASESAACDAAATAVADCLDQSPEGPLEDCPLEVAAGKLRACEAAIAAARIAHQIHGAVGFTAEHPLQRYTTRLIGWRSDFGTERYWASRLGKKVLALGSTGFWQELTSRKLCVEAPEIAAPTSSQAEAAPSSGGYGA